MRPFAFTEKIDDLSATIEADTAEGLAKLTGMPRPFVVPAGHVLKVLIHDPDGNLTADHAAQIQRDADKWLGDGASNSMVISGGKVTLIAVPMITMFSRPDSDYQAAGERMAAQRRAVGMSDLPHVVGGAP